MLLFCSSVKIFQCLCPRISRHHVSRGPADKVCSPKMDASVSTGKSSLVSGIMEGSPAQRHGTLRCNAKLDCRTPRDKCNGSSEVFAASPQRQDSRACRAECAVARDVFRKRRCGKCSQLVWNPAGAIGCDSTLSGTAPTFHLLTVEEIRDCSDGTRGVKDALCAPRGDPSIENCVCQCEKHLHVLVKA